MNMMVAVPNSYVKYSSFPKLTAAAFHYQQNQQFVLSNGHSKDEVQRDGFWRRNQLITGSTSAGISQLSVFKPL